MIENTIGREGDEFADPVDMEENAFISADECLRYWEDVSGLDESGQWKKKEKKRSQKTLPVADTAESVKEMVRNFVLKSLDVKKLFEEDEIKEVEREFWNNAGHIIGRFFDSYTEQTQNSCFSEYLEHIYEEVSCGESEMFPLPTKDGQREFMALRGIVQTLNYLIKKYKKKRRRVSGKLALQHPVRVMEVRNQVSRAFSDLHVLTGEGWSSGMESFIAGQKDPLRKSVAAMLHDVVEDFYDGEFTEKVEEKLRKLLVDIFFPIPESTEEDVEMVLKILRLTTKPATRYAAGKEGKDFDAENGYPKYMKEYEKYLEKIDLSVRNGKEEGKYAMEVKLMDILHNGATADPQEWNAQYVVKKQKKAALAGKYILSHFPNLRVAATLCPELRDLIDRIKVQDRFLYAEIMKLSPGVSA